MSHCLVRDVGREIGYYRAQQQDMQTLGRALEDKERRQLWKNLGGTGLPPDVDDEPPPQAA